jgi:microcystin-dependent protein
MSEPFIAEIRLVSFNFAPKGWALCNGQLLPINQNQALFSLLGTTYGGDGRVTFALPDLRSRVPTHWGSSLTLGQSGGEESHRILLTEMPQHLHTMAAAGTATTASPAGALWADGGKQAYGSGSPVTMADATVSTVGGSQSRPNQPPSLTLSFVIALQGIFPSRT